MINTENRSARTEILLLHDDPAEVQSILNVFRKARISNRIQVLEPDADVFQFLFRQDRFADMPPIPAETLILLSLQLKHLNGIDVLRRIKNDERFRSFPVILLTSSQKDRGVMEGYKLGANACIVQPMDLTKFVEAVAELRLDWLLVTPDPHHSAE